jgi:hypothetical protein
MVRQALYLDAEIYEELKATARMTGMTVNDVIRGRLRAYKSEGDIRRVSKKLNALFELVSFAYPNLGYMAGATLAGCKEAENCNRTGTLLEGNYRRVAESMRTVFEENEKT